MGRDGETEKKGCLGTEKADPLGIDELFGDTGFVLYAKRIKMEYHQGRDAIEL